ncbi:MAG: response regulator [Rhodospirillales bacterium]
MARILIVEDDYALGVLLGAALNGAGHRITLAADGSKGLDAAGRERVDLMIADLVMPGMSGRELIRAVRKAHPDVKIVAMSGQFAGDRGTSGLARTLGADAVLAKPFHLKNVRDTVTRCLAAA